MEAPTPPDGAIVLPTSDACRVQAMRVGIHAWSMQYHVEIEPDTAATWAEVPAYAAALQSTLGERGLTSMRSAASRHMPAFLECAETPYRNFSKVVRG